MPRGILVREGACHFQVQRGMTIILDPQSPRLGVMRRRRSQGYLDNGFPAGVHRVLSFESWVLSFEFCVLCERQGERL